MPYITPQTRELRRAKILDAAREQFTRNGFHATSMDDVALAAGVTAGVFGAVSNSAGSARRFSAVITLCEITANRSHAALAPSRPHGITPAPKSFFKTSCSASIVPAFSRCHCKSRTASQSHRLLPTAKCFTSLPSANNSPCRFRILMATYRNGPAPSGLSSSSGQ